MNEARQTPLPDLLDQVPEDIVLGIPGDESVFPSYTNIPIGRLTRDAAAELRRLHAENERLQARYEACRIAAHQWLDKTEWIQETGRACELGMHRADAVRQRLSAVEAQRDALLEALKRMASIIDTMGDMPDGFIHPSPWQTLKCEEALTQARAAIKAAEGEKS